MCERCPRAIERAKIAQQQRAAGYQQRLRHKQQKHRSYGGRKIRFSHLIGIGSRADTDKGMIRSLTALRFGAALLVFFWHAPATRPGAVEFSLGYIGVGFFYLLSGFILTYTYHELFPPSGKLARGSLRSFFAARFARIYPVHLFAMLITLVMLAFVGGEHWSGVPAQTRAIEIATQTVLLQSWFPSELLHFGVNGPAWSISDEQLFYALFPLLAIFIARLVRDADEKAVLQFAGALCVLFAAALLPVRAGFDQWNIYVFPPARLVDFCVGMLLGFAFLRRSNATCASGSKETLIELGAIAALLAGIEITALVPQSLRFAAAMMPFSAFAVYVFAMQQGAISRFLGSPVLVRLGEASYAFYLIHLDVMILVDRAFNHRHYVAAFFVALAVSIAAALAIFAYVETPLRRRLRSALAPLRAGEPAPVLLEGRRLILRRDAAEHLH